MVITGTAAVRRLLVVLVALGVGVAALTLSGVTSATGDPFPAATPPARCGKGALPETGMQGRVPAGDYASGRSAKGYECNVELVSNVRSTGGFKVLRYTDTSGRTCAYYDSTRIFPTDVAMQLRNGFGVYVLDMTNPKKPVRTATLTRVAMLSPHESLLVHEGRGLLAGVVGNAATAPGVVDIYDVHTDCRHPKLLSSTPSALLGHESGWSPDGRTLYASSTGGQTFVAIDVTVPTLPVPVFTQLGVDYHGLRLSHDGRTMYVANIGNDFDGQSLAHGGLRILDVSQIQDRVPNPQVPILSTLTWREGSIPQVAQPFVRGGRHYVLEVDEFAQLSARDPSDWPVGGARIIDVEDPRHPKVVSNLRLAVHQPAARKTAYNDPGANTPLGGYSAHYCSLPYRKNPRIVACSMNSSGLRLFDISRLRHPREVGYFNRPVTGDGASAMAQPAWDVRRRMVWFTDTGTGFYVVRLTHDAKRLVRRR